MPIAVALLTLACAATQAPASAPVAPPPSGGLYVVIVRTGAAWDAAKPAASQLHFKEHSANIRRLGAEGKLALGGRFSDMGLLVVRAPSEAEARALFDPDASIAGGTFRVEVHPWRTFAPGCLDAPAAPPPASPR
jgi:uncharacterized protein YciI